MLLGRHVGRRRVFSRSSFCGHIGFMFVRDLRRRIRHAFADGWACAVLPCGRRCCAFALRRMQRRSEVSSVFITAVLLIRSGLPSAVPFCFLALKTAARPRFALDLLLATVKAGECEALAGLVGFCQSPCWVNLFAIHLSRDTIASFVQVVRPLSSYLLHAKILPLRFFAHAGYRKRRWSIAVRATAWILPVFGRPCIRAHDAVGGIGSRRRLPRSVCPPFHIIVSLRVAIERRSGLRLRGMTWDWT